MRHPKRKMAGERSNNQTGCAEFLGWYFGMIPANQKKEATSWPVEKARACNIQLIRECSPPLISFNFTPPSKHVITSEASYVEQVDDSSRYFSTSIVSVNDGFRVHVGFAFRTRHESLQFFQSLQSVLIIYGRRRSTASESAKPSDLPFLLTCQSSLLWFFHSIFYAEGFIKLIAGLYIIFNPHGALSWFGVDMVYDQAADLFRWVGILVTSITSLVFFGRITRVYLEALLLGDFLMLAAWSHPTLLADRIFDPWSVWSISTLYGFLMIVRIAFLLTQSDTIGESPEPRSE